MVCQQIRVFFKALCRKNNLKLLESVKRLQKDPESYAWMLDNIAPLIVGSGKYREECKRVPPTSWMTPSSEAFAVLCLENYYDNIQDIASNKCDIRKPLWTNKGLGAKRNQGWSREGLERFEACCKAVERNRSSASSKRVDTTYMKERQARIDKNEERKRKRDETREKRESGWQVAHVDEWSDDGDGNKQQGEKVGRAQQGNAREDDSSEDEEESEIH